MTYNQMYQGCDNTDAMRVTKVLVGDAIWDRMYGKREVSPEHLVPVQLVTILTSALGKIEDEFKADAKRMAIIEKKFDLFYEKDLEDKAAAQGAYGVSPY